MDKINILIVLAAIIIAQSTAQDCKKEDKCKCVSDDGTGFDLSSMVDEKSFLEAKVNENLTFIFAGACGDSTVLPNFPADVDNACKLGYMLCKFSVIANASDPKTFIRKAEVLGVEKTMEYKMSGESLQILFPLKEQITASSVTFECAPNYKPSILIAPSDTDQINLTVFSPKACRKQINEPPAPHGFFYTFFVVLLTLLFVYLFFGILINYFLVGARGYEMIPNYDFWCKCWMSLKLFVIYVKNGCRVIPADDSYDAI